MKIRKKKHIPRSRVVGANSFWWRCPNRPKSNNGWHFVKQWESGYDDHNSWDTYLIMRYK